MFIDDFIKQRELLNDNLATHQAMAEDMRAAPHRQRAEMFQSTALAVIGLALLDIGQQMEAQKPDPEHERLFGKVDRLLAAGWNITYEKPTQVWWAWDDGDVGHGPFDELRLLLEGVEL